MKKIIHILLICVGAASLVACEKRDYPLGVEEMEHHYYAVFVPNNNSNVVVQRTQTALLKFPVQFYSSYTRSYDAEARYVLTTSGISNPAVRGVDFDITDQNGTPIPVADTVYSMIFPQAKKAMDTVYVKLLNNPTPGTRRMEIRMIETTTNDFYVDIFSTACRRPVEIR